ncbi:MAG: UvrD-helicase domain-containing protein [Cyanobium sp.]
MVTFEPNDFPLDPGVRLLEASAGTGKTFALAHLVLRLISEEQLQLRRLLVVTFTEAAAAELKDRVGRRLQEALRALEQPQRQDFDAVLLEWRQRRGSGCHDPLRARLLLALEELDGADITTIHGFCHRNLSRHALEAGRPPDPELETDSDTTLQQIAHDYWQQQVLPLPVSLLGGLGLKQVDPDRVRQLVASLDGDPALDLEPLPPELSLERPLAEQLPAIFQRRWQRFCDLWQAHGRALIEDFQAAAAQWHELGAKASKHYVRRYSKDRCAPVDGLIASLGAAGDYRAVAADPLLNGLFHAGTFCQEARRAEGDGRPIRLPQPALMEAVAALVDGPAELLLLHAGHWGRSELRRRRQLLGRISFSQLLEDLDPGEDPACPDNRGALDNRVALDSRASAAAPEAGAGLDPAQVPDPQPANPLLDRIGQRYDVALVDEFQDTDPIQWRILRRCFGGGQHRLVMVGDPKQAIYRFRGGDLATYLAARATASACYELSSNYRSTAPLVAAFNGLMHGPGLRRSGLEVPEVRAQAARSGPDGPALELLWLGSERPAGKKAVAKGTLERQLAPWIAALTANLIEEAAELDEAGSRRRLGPDDICLLVGDRYQAETLRAALEREGIASRLISRLDVMATAAATALQRLLDALADPADGNRLRLLAASPLLGWSARTIGEAGPATWSGLAGRLEQLSQRVPIQGLLGVLAELLDARVLLRLWRQGRLLADLQQVAALVQERLHSEQQGLAATADWLRRLRLDPERSVPEAHLSHSDREQGVVSVVTVHASKGLEYPLVICPYLWQGPGDGRRGGRGRAVRWQPPGHSRPRLDIHLNPHWGVGFEAAHQHRQAEEQERERLAYVAATRACHRLVLAWGPAAGHHTNPLFPWLFSETALPDSPADPYQHLGDADWRLLLEQGLAARGLAIRLIDPPAPRPRRLQPAALSGPPLACGPVPTLGFDRLWGRSSYTSWTRGSHHSGPVAVPIDADRDTEDPSPEAALEPSGSGDPRWPEQGPLAGFPRGAAAGDCLHRMLERLDFGQSLEQEGNRAVVVAELQRAGLGQQPLAPVLAGLEQLRQTPFGGELGSLRIADLDAGGRLHEMGFDLTLGEVRSADLAAAFRAHPGGSVPVDYGQQLAGLAIHSRGFLTGWVDLFFHAAAGGERRWWVADWKSNWLGRRDDEGRAIACGPDHYGPQAMAELMAANHYVLQAHLYLVALHRYLGWRLKDYDPRRHLGGFAYVFLRGTPGAAGNQALPGNVPGMLVDRPPLGRILALDDALGGKGP